MSLGVAPQPSPFSDLFSEELREDSRRSVQLECAGRVGGRVHGPSGRNVSEGADRTGARAMISNEFLLHLLVLIGGDGSDTDLAFATHQCEQMNPEIDGLSDAMCWTAAECDLMTLHAVFYNAHNRAPSWREFRDSVRFHVNSYGRRMLAEQRMMFRGLLAYDFAQLADAVLAATASQVEAKTAEFNAVKPIEPCESTKPVTQDAFRRVQQIPQRAPGEQPKSIQQRKPKPVHHVMARTLAAVAADES